jgi:hypothetical protein
VQHPGKDWGMLYHSGALVRPDLQDRLPGQMLVQCIQSHQTHTHTRICRLNFMYSTRKSCCSLMLIIPAGSSVTCFNRQQEGRHPRGRKELLHRDRRLGGPKRPQVTAPHTCTSLTNTHLFATMSAFMCCVCVSASHTHTTHTHTLPHTHAVPQWRPGTPGPTGQTPWPRAGAMHSLTLSHTHTHTHVFVC